MKPRFPTTWVSALTTQALFKKAGTTTITFFLLFLTVDAGPVFCAELNSIDMIKGAQRISTLEGLGCHSAQILNVYRGWGKSDQTEEIIIYLSLFIMETVG